MLFNGNNYLIEEAFDANGVLIDDTKRYSSRNAVIGSSNAGLSIIINLTLKQTSDNQVGYLYKLNWINLNGAPALGMLVEFSRDNGATWAVPAVVNVIDDTNITYSLKDSSTGLNFETIDQQHICRLTPIYSVGVYGAPVFVDNAGGYFASAIENGSGSAFTNIQIFVNDVLNTTAIYDTVADGFDVGFLLKEATGAEIKIAFDNLGSIITGATLTSDGVPIVGVISGDEIVFSAVDIVGTYVGTYPTGYGNGASIAFT